jgi:L-fuconolactonase
MAKTIDSHTHTLGHDTDELPRVGGFGADHAYSDKAYTHHDLIEDMEKTGVDEAVVVSIGTLMYESERANEYMMRSIEAYPGKLWGVSAVEYYDSGGSVLPEESLRANIKQAVGHDRLLGVRMLASSPKNDFSQGVDPESEWILNEKLEPVYDELVNRNKTLHVLCKPQQLRLIAELADRNPSLDIVVDHLAWLNEETSPDSGPWTDFERVAEHPNTYAKIASLGMNSGSGWPYEDLYPYIRNLLDWFGSDRLLFGTDYPYNDPWASYEELATWPQEADFLSARDLSWLHYRTFERVYK